MVLGGVDMSEGSFVDEGSFVVVDEEEHFRRWADIFAAERDTALFCSVASLCCSFLQCVFYLYFSTLRRTPGWLVFRGVLCDLINSLILLIVFSYPSLERHQLNAIFSVTTVFQVAASALRAFVYMYMLSIYRNPFQPERHRALYHLFVMCCSSAALMTLSAAPTPLSKLAMGQFVMPFAIFVVIGGSVHATVRMLVFLSRDRFGGDVELGVGGRSHMISCLARQRVAMHGMAYYLLYGTPLLLGVACSIALKCKADQPKLVTLTVMLATGRPVVSFIGWIAINDVLFKLCGVCSNKRRLHPPQTLPLLSEQGRRLTRRELAAQQMVQGIEEKGFKEELRFELLYSVARGLGQLAHEELHAPAALRRAASRTIAKGGGGGAGGPGAGGPGSGVETGPASSFHIELVSTPPEVSSSGQRRVASAELSRKSRTLSFLMPAAMSSVVSSPRTEPAAADASPPPRGEGEMERKATPGSVPLEQLRRTRTPQDVDLLTASWSSSDGLVRTKSRGETWVMRLKRRTGDERLKAVHYCLDDFRAIRDAFGISRSSYAASFPNDLTELASDWRAKLKESVSEGASGCFFYRVLTPTGPSSRQMSRLIVKQIAEPEKRTLMKILPAYRRHIEKQKGKSCICYLGCHAIPLSWTFSRKVYFVVMRNFWPARMWLTFDLKGATANRRVLDEDTLFKRGDSSAESRGPRSRTLRDWEWLDMAMAVDVSARDRTELASMICQDSEFLGAQGLLDYSLLLGIHRIPQGITGEERREHIDALVKAGGYVSLDRQKVYFFGIIDVLERYSVRWKAQHALLKAGYHLICRGAGADGISAMSPLDYADRFRTFILREVLQINRRTQVRSFGFSAGQLMRSEERWAPLWESRRRGLVRERIEAATEDHTHSTEELGRQASRWARRIEELEAALRATGVDPPGTAPSESERLAIRVAASADHRLRASTSVGSGLSALLTAESPNGASFAASPVGDGVRGSIYL